jgi:D-3-phosphoglycerate dehydrogenase
MRSSRGSTGPSPRRKRASARQPDPRAGGCRPPLDIVIISKGFAMHPRVLISDALSETAVNVFRDRGIDVDFQPELGPDKEKLARLVGEFDGLAIRSATKVTPKVIAAANGRLRVIGRAGIGVDNVDLSAATAAGIIVMNTPFGNSITTAEHAVAMLFACARQIPAADQSTQAGKWEKSRFMGVEVTGKVLGIIGCGNIGSVVATRALGLQMHVIAFDPFLSDERAAELGVEKVDLDTLFRRADFITLHTPLTDKTRNIIDAEAIAKMRDGVRIVNCARGGLVVEEALRAALDSGKVAGAAIDVFASEPAKENVLFGAPNVVCTPHLGAATSEAQENVAIQVAEQMADYLTTGAVRNAINMPSISAEEAPRLTPFVRLAEQLGSFAGQLTETSVKAVKLEYEGAVAEMNVRALTAAVLAGFLRPVLQTVNMVSAPAHAKERGIHVEETRRERIGVYESYIRLTVVTERQERSVAGTVFSDGKPRIIQIKGINMEAELSEHMLYITNYDRPGFIGHLGTVLGDNNINIARMQFGRDAPGGNAIALVSVDQTVPADVMAEINRLEHVQQLKPLAF